MSYARFCQSTLVQWFRRQLVTTRAGVRFPHFTERLWQVQVLRMESLVHCKILCNCAHHTQVEFLSQSVSETRVAEYEAISQSLYDGNWPQLVKNLLCQYQRKRTKQTRCILSTINTSVINTGCFTKSVYFKVVCIFVNNRPILIQLTSLDRGSSTFYGNSKMY